MSSKKPQIEFSKSSPYIVRDLKILEDINGKDIPCKSTIVLCRCGLSERQPFCDGRHANTGFNNETGQGGCSGKFKEYRGEDMNVYFDLGVCSHAAVCITALPAVFNLRKRPWINPNEANWEEIVRVIDACPSGALKYVLKGKQAEPKAREAKITVVSDGPLNIEGGIELKGDTKPPVDEDRYCLCRCGKTKNTPFCDGEHLRK